MKLSIIFRALALSLALLLFPPLLFADKTKGLSKEDLAGFSLAGITVLEEKDRVPALEFALPELKTNNIKHLKDYAGKVLVLNFWATWCPPCRAEMPMIEALHRELGPAGLEWLAINSGEEPAKVQSYIAEKNYSFQVLLDRKNEGLIDYGIPGLPATLIVNKAGDIVALAMGSVDWRKDSVIEAFRRLLRE